MATGTVYKKNNQWCVDRHRWVIQQKLTSNVRNVSMEGNK